MKRTAAVTVLLALAVWGGAFAYQNAAREREYRALLGQGDGALRDGQTFGAIEAYSGAIALRPDSMLAHLKRGETYQQRSDLDAAARDFRRAAELAPSATRPLEALGDVSYDRRRFRRAAEFYEARLRLDDQSASVTYKLALARYRDGDVDRALAALDETMSLTDRLADAHYLRGVCLRETRQLPEALAALEKAVALAPGLIPAREELADIYASLGRTADQLEQLQLIAGLDRTHVERKIALGLAHAKAGRGELAVLTLGNALEQAPDESLIYGALGRVWLAMADTRGDALSKALEALERVAPTAAASSEVLTLYGRALLDADRPEEAEQVLRQATQRYPIDPASLLGYARAAELQNHFDTARRALIEYGALAYDEPDSGARAARIARLSMQLNDAATAVTWYQRASSSSPGDVRLLAGLADAQIQVGDLEAARATIASGLEKDPENPELLALARRSR